MKHNHILAILCCAVMLLGMFCTVGAVSGTADEPVPAKSNVYIPEDVEVGIAYEREPDPDSRYISLDGEIGTKYLIGDLVYEIVTPEMVEEISKTAMPIASTQRFNIALNGNSRSEPFEVTERYPYAKVWVSLKEDSGNVKFNITKATPTGYVVKGSQVTIEAGQSMVIYSTKQWDADLYFANFTCGEAEMKGTASCRVGSSIEEVLP